MPSDFDSLDAELAEIDGKTTVPAKISSKLLPATIAFIALVSFTVIVVYAYNQGIQEGSEESAPVLRAEGPSKVPPQSPGGLEVPHQKALIYNVIANQQVDEVVERLLPLPQTPLPKPTVSASPPPAAVPAPPPKLSVPAASASADQSVSDLPPPVPPAASAPDTPPPEAPKAVSPPARLATQPQQTAALSADAAKPTVPAESPQVVGKLAFRIQIASLTNPEAANIEWSRRSEQHKDILGSLTLVVKRANLGSRGTFYRVQAGPLPSREAASALCEKLKQRKVGCLVVQP